MPLEDQGSWSELAWKALAELDADQPNKSPAQLMGGPLAWGDSSVAVVEAERDPANAATMRPHVIAPCQQLQRHRAMRLHCTCGKGLDYLALASFATGVLVVSSPRLLPKKRRAGGPLDLASTIEGSHPDAGWALIPWETSMRAREAAHQTGWKETDSHPALGFGARVIGDAAKRQIFTCANCGATHTFVNINLLRMVLQAIANGEGTVRIGGYGTHKAAT